MSAITLAAQLKTVREEQGDLKLLNLTNRNRHPPGLLKLRTDFGVHDDEAEALKSFARTCQGPWPRACRGQEMSARLIEGTPKRIVAQPRALADRARVCRR